MSASRPSVRCATISHPVTSRRCASWRSGAPPGRSVGDEILAFARSRNATRVVVGKSQRSRWFELRHGSVVDQLVRSSSGLAVEVAPSGDARPIPSPTDWLFSVPLTPGPYLEGVLTAAVATGLGKLIDAHIVLPNISLLYVVPVLIAAARHGLVPSLWVSALSVLAYNFFFAPPTSPRTAGRGMPPPRRVVAPPPCPAHAGCSCRSGPAARGLA